VDGTNFIGTTDNVPFNVRVNNQKAGRIDNTLNNAFWGYQAGNANTTGASNTATGAISLSLNTTGGSNSAYGARALLSNTTGATNTAIGANALQNNTIGISNTASGVNALFSNTTGSNNTATGVASLVLNTTGANNTANGFSALQANTIGASNTATGYAALILNATGGSNTAAGVNTLASNSTGNSNTANGVSAMFSNTSGSGNTAHGMGALAANVTGTNNTAVGINANVASGNLTNATAIGNGATVSASNTVNIGNTAVTDVYFGNGTTTVLHATLAGSTAPAFADFFALMPGDNAATVGSGSSVQFPQDGPSNSIITRTSASTFNLPAIGTYEVNFQVSVTESGQLMLVLNGVELPQTVVGGAIGSSQISGSCLITTTSVNSTLSLNNPVGNVPALTITPQAGGQRPVSAHLVIKRLN